MNLILFKRSEISETGSVNSIKLHDKDPRTKHIFGHLRKADGDSVTIGIIGGGQGKAILRTASDGNRLEFDHDLPLLQDNKDIIDDDNELVLVISLPFPKRLKALWPQITSMGVSRIVIIRGALSDANYCKSSSILPEVYRPLVEEGMSQGCHTKEVTVEVEVGEAVSRSILEKLVLFRAPDEWSKHGEAAIFLDCGDETMEPPPCRQVIVNKLSKLSTETRKRVILAIGSERGWTEDEAKLFHQAGFESASLGRSILRVDTAVIAGLGIASATLDEFRTEKQRIRDRKRKQDNQNS
eukprot:CAMPEP_0116124160 /NCGR_PEP_ID=MMETSP0329-20121206/5137_1 /TAXON_ID=697910 /ORGANISM="Pseudo-nitzschia arenysensis, Strain B593" /LENGTH=296 /DNA_ID=CAMNT_0003618131 /DNA_START=130 /DNA_END=1020 /DNA_ORIENTATION=+